MAGSVATVWANLRLNISDFSSGLSKASRDLRKFANEQALVNRHSSGYGEASKMLRSFNRSLSDTINITRGITISQTFYALVGTIRDASAALWDFNVALDYMKVTYSALFGSAKVAEDFMAVLQEHSIETIFDYQTLADASKKLLAYGIEYENLMFIMEGLTNLGAMSGDAAALDRISLALGQIFTKGKLDATEMKQLANAYIPITEILQDKFGLTGEELDRVGDLNLPAAEVINAIVDYANENFASVGDAAMLTITGLQNRIVDTLKVVGASMMQPLTKAYKSFLVYVSRGLESIRGAYESGGIGGVFEYLVPDEGTQQIIRQFIANVRNLFMALVSVGIEAGKVFGNVAHVVAVAFNILSPIVTGFINLLALVVSGFLDTRFGAAALRVALVGAAAAFVLLKVQAIGALVITAVTKAVHGLSKALLVLSTIISEHPVAAILIGLAAAVIGISVASDSANSSISGLFDTLTGLGGSTSEDTLQNVQQGLVDSANAANQFNNRLEEGANAADNLSEAIGGAGKAAKKTSGLLSFDEVFKLPEQKDSGSGSGLGGLVGNLEDLAGGFENLGSELGESLIPEIPDFSQYANDFTDGLITSIKDAIPDKLKSALTGGSIGSIIGYLIGLAFKNPELGAAIGAGVGAFAGYIWETLEGAVSNTGIMGAAGVLSAISKYLAKEGAGSFGTLLLSAFKSGGFKGLWKALGNVIKNTGKAALTKGGVIGIAIGLVTDGIAHLLWSWLDEKIAGADKETAKIGQTIGSIWAGIIGMLLGGPTGAMIGSAIGTFVGGLIGLFWDELVKAFKKLGMNLGTIIGGGIGSLWGPIGAVLGAGLGTVIWDLFDGAEDEIDVLIGWLGKLALKRLKEIVQPLIDYLDEIGFLDWAEETLQELKGWVDETKGTFEDFAADTKAILGPWWADTKAGFTQWYADTIAILAPWWSDTKEGFTTWWSDTKEGFTQWVSSTFGDLWKWFNDTLDTFSDWDSINSETLGNWWQETKAGFTNWYSDTKTKLSAWWTETTAGFNKWWIDTKATLDPWWQETKAGFTNWYNETVATLTNWYNEALKPILDWARNSVNAFLTWRREAEAAIYTFIWDTITSIRKWCLDVTSNIIMFVVGAVAKFNEFKEKVKKAIVGMCYAALLAIGDWLSDTGTKIYNWCDNTAKDIKSWWANMFNIDSWKSGWSSVKDWFSNLLDSIKNWFIGPNGLKSKISDWWKDLWNGKDVSINTGNGTFTGFGLGGHATGGIFNKEHLARFAEGNKAEAIIPLENNRAMQPFVDAVSNGLVSTLAPLVAQSNSGGAGNLPPLYVGTLIADDRGLKELYKKFEIIQLQENDRRGTNATV